MKKLSHFPGPFEQLDNLYVPALGHLPFCFLKILIPGGGGGGGGSMGTAGID